MTLRIKILWRLTSCIYQLQSNCMKSHNHISLGLCVWLDKAHSLSGYWEYSASEQFQPAETDWSIFSYCSHKSASFHHKSFPDDACNATLFFVECNAGRLSCPDVHIAPRVTISSTKGPTADIFSYSITNTALCVWTGRLACYQFASEQNWCWSFKYKLCC